MSSLTGYVIKVGPMEVVNPTPNETILIVVTILAFFWTFCKYIIFPTLKN